MTNARTDEHETLEQAAAPGTSAEHVPIPPDGSDATSMALADDEVGRQGINTEETVREADPSTNCLGGNCLRHRFWTCKRICLCLRRDIEDP